MSSGISPYLVLLVVGIVEALEMLLVDMVRTEVGIDSEGGVHRARNLLNAVIEVIVCLARLQEIMPYEG